MNLKPIEIVRYEKDEIIFRHANGQLDTETFFIPYNNSLNVTWFIMVINIACICIWYGMFLMSPGSIGKFFREGIHWGLLILFVPFPFFIGLYFQIREIQRSIRADKLIKENKMGYFLLSHGVLLIEKEKQNTFIPYHRIKEAIVENISFLYFAQEGRNNWRLIPCACVFYMPPQSKLLHVAYFASSQNKGKESFDEVFPDTRKVKPDEMYDIVNLKSENPAKLFCEELNKRIELYKSLHDN